MTSQENQRQNPEQRPAKSEEELRRQAEELKDSLRERAGSVADTAQEKISEVAEQAGEQARRVAHAAEDEAKSMATERKSEVASQLDNVAQAFRSSGSQLRSDQHGGANVANYMDRAAEGVSQVSSYLRDRNIDEMLMDAEDFARRQPELFLGGAFALGVLAARFFKSSARSAQEEYAWQREEYAITRQPRPLPPPEATERQRSYPRHGREDW